VLPLCAGIIFTISEAIALSMEKEGNRNELAIKIEKKRDNMIKS